MTQQLAVAPTPLPTATTPRTAAAPPRTPSHRTAGLNTLHLGPLHPMHDIIIVNEALPTIDNDLAAGTAVLELVAAGYGIAFAVLLVLGGRLG
ncbi:MFS transporter, partial [Streptomyces sp. SP17BM10]|nr:MFS transporter [Streptomyces sp. SP17BM10]